jgi:hypothetical protein
MISTNKIILSTIVTSIGVVVFIVIIMVAIRNKNRQFFTFSMIACLFYNIQTTRR